MNAKDRLRLYLEQRRELGESELVLDSLPVDAVLRMIGAPLKQATAASQTQSATTSAPVATPSPSSDDSPIAATSTGATLTPVPPPAPVEPELRFNETASADWRTVLKNAAAESQGKSVQDAFPTSAPSSNTNTDSNVKVDVSSNTGATQPFPKWLLDLGVSVGLTAIAPSGSPTTIAATSVSSLSELASIIATCRACALGDKALNAVPGEGNANADLVCVGEAPGQTEDETGRPFVGAAGQLLTKILAAIQLQREDVFICNVLKHRPPGNRNPAPDEVHACTPYLTRQLALIKPKVILALGTFAAQTLLNTSTPVGKLRGQVHRYEGVPLIVTYHPSALLRNESWKRPAWDDVRLARRVLDASRLEAARAGSEHS